MRALVALVRATHPLPALAVTVLVGAVAAARGADGGTLAWAVGSTAAGQASVGWSNDYLDRHRDTIAGRSDKPLVAGDVLPTTVIAAALVALPASVALSLPVGVIEAAIMAAAVGAAWAYNLGLKATVLSWVPYAVAFGLAPGYIWLAASESLPPGWVAAATALLGVAAHLMNALPDLEADRAGAVPGVAHRLGFGGSLAASCVALAGLLVLVLVADGVPATAGQLAAAAAGTVLIASVVLAGVRGATRVGFRLTVLAAGAIVATFVLSPAASRL